VKEIGVSRRGPLEPDSVYHLEPVEDTKITWTCREGVSILIRWADELGDDSGMEVRLMILKKLFEAGQRSESSETCSKCRLGANPRDDRHRGRRREHFFSGLRTLPKVASTEGGVVDPWCDTERRKL
jgi:hypothetical protein